MGTPLLLACKTPQWYQLYIVLGTFFIYYTCSFLKFGLIACVSHATTYYIY